MKAYRIHAVYGCASTNFENVEKAFGMSLATPSAQWPVATGFPSSLMVSRNVETSVSSVAAA